MGYIGFSRWPTIFRGASRIRHYLDSHCDFWLLWVTAVTFRLGAVLFLRPGGYVRDYSDLIYYYTRASWQDFGFLPYRDYWSEYPPLFPWITIWIDRLTRSIPFWDDSRLWFAALFGLLTVVAEGGMLVCLYWLARRLYHEHALRAVWLYGGLFLPVYLLGGWFDALPVAALMAALTTLLIGGPTSGPLAFGLLAGIGGALKLVPLVLLVVVPLARRQWRERMLAWGLALGVFLGIYLVAYFQGPTMTLASLRSLVERSGWSTLYAWAEGYQRVGAVVGDVFDPAAEMSLYESRLPRGAFAAPFVVIAAGLWIVAYRQYHPPQPVRQVITLTGTIYALLLVAYPAWNPQYALYVLPFIMLALPNARGLLYSIALSAACLAEHPVLVNLIGPGGPLLLWIIVVRTMLLVAVAMDLALLCLRPLSRLRWASLILAGLAAAGLIAGMPAFAQAYVANRFASSPERPLVLYLNSLPMTEPVVTQQLRLARRLRPFLEHPERLLLAGGRPGRVEPLPALLANGGFRYIEAPGDIATPILQYLETSGVCARRWTLAEWWIWVCHDAMEQPLARFAGGLVLHGALIPQTARVGQPVPLALFWRAETSVNKDYTVFVHIVDAHGQMVGQWDQVPAAGAAPTSSWQPGRIVVDEYQVPLNGYCGPQPCRILVGLYLPQNGERLEIVSSSSPFSERQLELHILQVVP